MARPRDPLARSALVAAARREFVRVGLQRARIEDITNASGLSKGAFYLHFESKEALFRELVTELEAQFEKIRAAREFAYIQLLSAGLPTQKDPGPFVQSLLTLEGVNDRKVLELFWDWRDVIDVLLRGSQGTEFENVFWSMLDRESARVEVETEVLMRAGLIRDDLYERALGPIVVGTYLMHARRMASLPVKPDIDQMVNSLQSVLADGVASKSLRAHRDRATAPLRVRSTAPRSPVSAAAASARRRRS
jgi:AcrR family transcriptional regulator